MMNGEKKDMMHFYNGRFLNYKKELNAALTHDVLWTHFKNMIAE